MEIVFEQGGPFSKALRTAEQFARSNWPVLLLGETGVGKEIVASHIHRHSLRAARSFFPVNCGALPAGLVESELFGHVKGAFSGAENSSRGLIRNANGGTLFLDEVGELPMELQVKLLRLLDMGEIRSVGSTQIESVDIRVVAATHVDLGAAIAKKTFRLDLLERLSVLTLSIPPLRERNTEIELFCAAWSKAWGMTLEKGVVEKLKQYSWPGNVRQLRNVLMRAKVLGEGRVTIGNVVQILIQEEVLHGTQAIPSEEISLEEIERQTVISRLLSCKGNRKEAAKKLGIAKSTLHEKLRKWKTDSPNSIMLS